MTSSATAVVNWPDRHFELYGQEVQCSPHRLGEREDLFSKEALIALLDRFPRHELQAFTMGHDPCDPSDWSCVDVGDASGAEIWEAMSRGRMWLNLLWIDKSEPEYGKLLKQLYEELGARVPRLEGRRNEHLTLLISSPGAQVYYHFDAEDNMLWHISGRKSIWVWPNSQRELAPPQIVEDIFARTASEELPFKMEYEPAGQRFDLEPGQVVSWPHNAPHRVQNADTINVSISTSVETPLSERRRLTYCANRMLRQRFGMKNLSTEELGLVPALKRFVFRLARKLGWFPDPPMPIYRTQLQIDPESENGLRTLDAPVHTAFCSTRK